MTRAKKGTKSRKPGGPVHISQPMQEAWNDVKKYLAGQMFNQRTEQLITMVKEQCLLLEAAAEFVLGLATATQSQQAIDGARDFEKLVQALNKATREVLAGMNEAEPKGEA